MAFNGTGSNVTSLNAANIATSTMASARLATGTANSTTFLRGDQTWASAGGGALTGNTLQTITSTTTTTIDVSDGDVVNLTMASDITTLAFSNVPAGNPVQLVITFINASDGTPYNVTWPANIYWNSTTGPSGSVIGPTLTTGPNSLTVISLLTIDGGTKWQGWTEATIPGQSVGNFLYAWGDNSQGQLGQGNTIARSSPVQVGSLTNWAELSISASASASFAIKTDGTLWGWGYNGQGQLGLNDTVLRSSPTQIGSLTNWSKVSAGSDFTLAIKTNGTLWSWGNGARYRTGQGNPTSLSSPVQVGSATDWAKISAGTVCSMAIKTTGTLWAWGNNTWGTAGNGSAGGDITTPTQTGSDTNWAEINVSFYRAILVKTTGTMWAAGYNYTGGLGLGISNNTGSRSSLTQIGSDTDWSKIASGTAFTIAKKTTGALWAWGGNGGGQLGQNNTIARSSPVQIGAATDWDKVYATSSASLAVKSNGALWSWGTNNSGQLSQGNTVNLSSPVQVGALTTWGVLGTGAGHIMALQPAPAINPA